jgi:hypothetical protein
VGATLVLVAIALLEVRYGHAAALSVLLVLLLLVALIGGSGSHEPDE